VIGVHTGRSLGELRGANPLVTAWLSGGTSLGDAAAELALAFAPTDGLREAAPIWRDTTWLAAWTERALADLPDPAAGDLLRDRIASLQAGEADVVITGQQPGFLGGPLYTLLKVATTVVLAELRSAAGRPTLPIFWSGDDDDDLAEALHPVLYDPARGTLLHARAMRSAEDTVEKRQPAADLAATAAAGEDQAQAAAAIPVGVRAAAEYEQGAAAWLAEQAGRGGLVAELSVLWTQAIREEWSWARLQRRALLRLFAPAGLLIVSGDDPALHGAAAVFYRRVWQERDRWSAAVARGGRQLVADGHTAQLSPAATERFLYERTASGRQKLATAADTPLPEPERLRPGVALRAAVQDWLFRPAAVVVGPAELAYLKQLTPAYAEWSLPRAPLIPRLFAHLVPAEYRAAIAAAAAGATADVVGEGHPLCASEGVEQSERFKAVAERVVAPVNAKLVDALAAEAGAPRRRAERLANERTASWTRAVNELLHRERERERRAGATRWPVWVVPGGERQERKLAVHCATALWGEELVAAILHAARRHIDAGLDGRWQEFLLEVPSPE